MILFQTNYIKLFYFFILLNLIFFYSTKATANNDYCSYNVDKLPANVLIIDTLSLINQNGEYNKDSLKIFQTGLKDIKDGTKLGQKLIIYKYTKDGSPQRIFDECKPGCPDTSVLERIVGGVCNKGESLGHIKKYGQNSNGAIALSIKEAKNNNTDNNIISKISSLSNEFKQLSSDDNIFIFSNLMENSKYGNFYDTDNESVFDRAFVKVINNKLIPTNYGNNIRIYGVESHKLVLDFWKDLFSINNSKPELMSNLLY